MKTYRYNPETGEYLTTDIAPLDPLETKIQGRDVYLIGADSTAIEPPIANEKQVAVWNVSGWTLEEDHRQKRDQGGVIIEGSGTAYWLPEDKHTIPARHMTSIGKLPAGAVLTPPPPTLEEAKAAKLAEIASAYDTVFAYVVSPDGSGAVAAALAVADFTADDPEGLAFIRQQLKARRAELEVAVAASFDAAAVQAIVVTFKV